MNQMAAGIGVDWDDRGFLHQHGLRLEEARVALLASRGLRREVKDEFVIAWSCIARIVVATAIEEKIEKVVRIHVVPNPTPARHG